MRSSSRGAAPALSVRPHPKGDDAILYVNCTGCTWRMLPRYFAVSCSAAHQHFLHWVRDGTWNRASSSFADRSPWLWPQSRARRRVIDSCSIRASPVRGPRRFDGAKKIDGIKRHVVVDTLDPLVAVLVTAASVQDRAAVPGCSPEPATAAPVRPSVGRRGLHRQRLQALSRILRFTLQIVGGIKPKGGLSPASSLGRRADVRLNAPLPMPHPPIRADSARP
jgi:transposase